MECDHFRIVFDGVILQFAMAKDVEIKVAGPSNLTSRTRLAKKAVFTRYRDGVNTLTFSEAPHFVMKIFDEGLKAEVDGKTFSLEGGPKRVIVVYANGAASVI
jgi:hypothetical protein